ncbi:MAG: amidohydrolase family protein [Acidobacteriaceae bacterium]|nr:amidohydrolase family protein [Acidobacteriaceae bacterium]
MKRIVLVCFTVLLAGTLHAQTTSAVLVLRGGTLVDVASGKEIPDSIILIRGDRIEKVGSGNMAIPDGAQTIDAAGKWIVPGLIDSHAHAENPDETPFSLYLANGVTTIRNPGGNITVLRLTRDRLLRGELIGPRLFFSGPLLDGIPPVWPDMSLLVDTPQRATSAVNFLADQGVDFVKVYNNVKEPELKAIIETAKERGLPVAGHIPRSMTMTRAIELGMTRLEHIRITGREMLSAEEAEKIDPLPLGRREPTLWQRFDLQSEKMQALVQRLAKSKIFLDPTLLITEITEVPNMDAEKNDPNNKYLPPKIVERDINLKSPIYELPAELQAAGVEAFQKQEKFVGMCNQAGVKIIAGTDGPSIGSLLPGFGLHHELELLVASGLSPLQALRAATSTAAEALGKNDRLGTVEAGKFADMIVLDADPLQDVHNLTKISLLVQGGKTYSPDALLQQAWAQANKKP